MPGVDDKVDSLRCLDVDDQLNFRGFLRGKVGRLSARQSHDTTTRAISDRAVPRAWGFPVYFSASRANRASKSRLITSKALATDARTAP